MQSLLPLASDHLERHSFDRMMLYLWIALGGALGSVGRFALSGLAAQHCGESFPWGTLLVNVAGSFAIGFIATLTAPGGRLPLSEGGRHFFSTGVLGGFTTFSAFSLQTLNLLRDGDWARASGNAIGSLGLCLAAAWLGHVAALGLNSLKGS